jgi:transcriptional regulator with XRE-family HTH domain
VVSRPANESVDEARSNGLRRLGDLLKARRAELRPEDVGLEPRGRRRVIGLRRHEVADIAGVSVTWYTWLEQGRDIHVSSQALDAIACALKQTDDAWKYMRLLAGIPVPESLVAAEVLRDDLSVLVNDLPYPTCITTGPADLLGWNAAFSALFGDPSELPPSRRNTFWLMLTSPFLRDRVADFDQEFADSVAMLRADAARYASDPHFEEVVNELCADGRFRELWTSHEVRQFHGPHLTTLVLGSADVLRLQRYLLRPIDEPALRMMIFKPVDTHSQQRLRTLLPGSP